MNCVSLVSIYLVGAGWSLIEALLEPYCNPAGVLLELCWNPAVALLESCWNPAGALPVSYDATAGFRDGVQCAAVYHYHHLEHLDE